MDKETFKEKYQGLVFQMVEEEITEIEYHEKLDNLIQEYLY